MLAASCGLRVSVGGAWGFVLVWFGVWRELDFGFHRRGTFSDVLPAYLLDT